MKIFILMVCLLVLSLILTGCASAKIATPMPQSQNCQSQVIHNSFYGFRWAGPDPIFEKGRLHSVTAKTNMLFAFVSVFSIGLYVPQDVEWYTVAIPQMDPSRNGIKQRPPRK